MQSDSRVEITGLKPIAASRGLDAKFWLAGIWLVFTLALAGWWMMFGLNQLRDMRDMATGNKSSSEEEFARQHRMLLSEGLALMVLLLGGGVAILYGIRVEKRRARQIEEFFASFTHDLKTSLASLRVQTESLKDDLGDASDSSSGRLLNRIMADAGRLETQLENALYLADSERGPLLVETVELASLVAGLSHHWPHMKIEFSGDGGRVLGDRRAMESIIRNLAQNASRHGGASELKISSKTKGEQIEVRFEDNGRGFQGDLSRLGRMFDRQHGSSGSGIGLYLVGRLVARMGGSVELHTGDQEGAGFTVIAKLPAVESQS